jgi:O-antigen/teichoic acid export membrane protein
MSGEQAGVPVHSAAAGSTDPSETPRDGLLARFVTMNLMGQGASLAIGLCTSILLARLLGPSDRGLLGVMLTASTLALVLLAVGLPDAVTYFSSLPGSDARAILGNSLAQAAGLGAVLIPAVWLLHEPIADALSRGEGGLTWVLAAALVPVVLLDWTTNSQLQGRLRFARVNVILVLSRLGYAFGVAILVGALSWGVAGAIAAVALGALVTIALSIRPILRGSRPRFDLALMRRLYSYGARAEVGSLLQLANGRLDVLILQIYRPLSEVGYYVVAQTIAEIVVVVANQFRWTGMVLVARLGEDDERVSTTAGTVRHYTAVGAAATVGTGLAGTVLVLLGYGPEFHSALVPMLILLPGVWMLGIGVVVQGDLSGRGRPGLASGLAGISALTTTALDFALIPPLGATGAALASLIGYSLLGVVSIWTLHRVGAIALRALLVPTRADLGEYRRSMSDRLRALRTPAEPRL